MRAWVNGLTPDLTRSSRSRSLPPQHWLAREAGLPWTASSPVAGNRCAGAPGAHRAPRLAGGQRAAWWIATPSHRRGRQIFPWPEWDFQAVFPIRLRRIHLASRSQPCADCHSALPRNADAGQARHRSGSALAGHPFTPPSNLRRGTPVVSAQGRCCAWHSDRLFERQISRRRAKRRQYRQSLHELPRAQFDVVGAVALRGLEPPRRLALCVAAQSLVGQRGAGDGAAPRLQFLAGGGLLLAQPLAG